MQGVLHRTRASWALRAAFAIAPAGRDTLMGATLVLALAAGSSTIASVRLAAPGAARSQGDGQRPCDVYDADPATSCVAAHSITRALYANYSGPLYQLQRTSDNATADIFVRAVGGVADAAAQERFCCNSACHIWRIYDQSPHRNHLHVSTAPAAPMKEGSACRTAMSKICGRQRLAGGNDCVPCLVAHEEVLARAGCKPWDMDDELWCGPDNPVNASRGPVSLSGHRVFSAVFEGGMGYRLDNTSGMAKGDEAETMYMVVSGSHYNDRCCFDVSLCTANWLVLQ